MALKSFLLSSSRRKASYTASQTSAIEEPTVAQMDLLKIPPEIFYTIYEHLSFSDALSLTLTCTKLYYSDAAVRYVHREVRSSKMARFELRCTLEDDERIKGYHCQGCMGQHSLRSFSCEELTKSARNRYCLRTMKCFLLTPAGYVLSFNDMVKLSNEAHRNCAMPIWDSSASLMWWQKSVLFRLRLFDHRYVRNKEHFLELCTGLIFRYARICA